MFGFATQKNRQEVQRVLTSRMNDSCLNGLNPRDRSAARTVYCEVVWAIPHGRTGLPDFAYTFPVVSKDISVNGLSLIHTEPIASDPLLIGLLDSTGPIFIRCVLEHCTSLGYSFYQIGLAPEEIVSVNEADMAVLNRRLEQFVRPSVPAL